MGAIIWLASYPKSGNTWMRAFLHNLLMNTREPVDINSLVREAAAQLQPQAERQSLTFETRKKNQ